MLILARKIDEGIVIGHNIEVKVIAVEGNQVKLGIIAPEDMTIIRKEIVDAVKKENVSAGQIESCLNLNIVTPKKD